MSLPSLIEMVPLPGPVEAEISVPGSKSITNRALVLAALGEGEATLRGALWSEDTQVMVDCLQELGFMVNVEPDADERCNRTITVYGLGGRVPRGGTEAQPMELFVGNAGTAARFLTALVCLGEGVYRVHGVARMHERPQAALITALRGLGYRIDSPNDRLPARVHGAGPRGGRVTVSIADSSQFASALLLSARTGGWEIEVTGENADESPYVRLTTELVGVFPRQGGTFVIEPDASGGSYFWGASSVRRPARPSGGGLGDWSVRVRDWPVSTWQIDARFPRYLGPLLATSPGPFFDREKEMIRKHGADWRRDHQDSWPEGLEALSISRRDDLGDSIMTAITLAPLAGQPMRFTELGRLRVQECERVMALRTELTRCGAQVVETGDTLEIFPSRLHGAEIDTYGDHRMAMCFAILGLKVPGIKIKDPSCAKKTFPNFFQKLATPPPQGLGAVVLDARTGRALPLDQLFAD